MEHNEEYHLLHRIVDDLAWQWKSFYGLFTQYVGYLTLDIAKTLMSLKRIADDTMDFDCTSLSYEKVNRFALQYNLRELPNIDGIEKVLPRLWKCLDEYDLSSWTFSDEAWNSFFAYLEERVKKKGKSN